MNQPHPRPGCEPQLSPAEVAHDFPHERFELARPEDLEHIVTYNLAWLMSSYQYAFGTFTCQGIDPANTDVGRCGYDALITDEEDRERVIDVVERVEGDSVGPQ